jgi:hypothetical protein
MLENICRIELPLLFPKRLKMRDQNTICKLFSWHHGSPDATPRVSCLIIVSKASWGLLLIPDLFGLPIREEVLR